MASGSSERSKSWVIDGEPRQSVDRRLIMVETEAQDLASGAGIVAGVLGAGGVFGLPEFVPTDVFGPAAFDNLETKQRLVYSVYSLISLRRFIYIFLE